MYLKQRLLTLIAQALDALQTQGVLPAGPAPEFELDRPAAPEHGAYATNLALKLTKAARRPPRTIAEALRTVLAAHTEILERVEVAGPGFVNLHLQPSVLLAEAEAVRAAGEAYGRAEWGKGRKLLLEFVSANPTGPLNIVSARAAAVGDALARVLKSQGVRVDTEYYINDAGNQARLLGASLLARYRQSHGQEASVPAEGYHGEYVAELAKEISEEEPQALRSALESPDPDAELLKFFTVRGVERIVQAQRTALQEFGVEFTSWFHEKDLVEPPPGSGTIPVGKVIEQLRKSGHCFEQDGAQWFRSTTFGDDKDRVIEKSDGTITYLATDVAYHVNKFDRGFTELVDIWGPDHHGYIARLRAALQALGHPTDSFRVLITQQVNLYENGQPVAMSKRAGRFVTMADLVAEVGRDVARFFFLMRSTDAHLDFDLDLARKHTEDNPVFYVQYAHARICSILRKARTEGLALPSAAEPAAVVLPATPDELALARELAAFPEVLEGCARLMEPHGLTFYLRDLATVFHRFYTVCRVVDPAAPERSRARLALTDAVRQVLHNGLDLLGISAPETM